LMCRTMETYFGDHVIPYAPLQRKYQEKYHTCGFQIGKKYRSHFEIIALIVEAVKEGGQAKFSIMKHANINCGQLNKFLGSLIQIGFIEQSTMDGRPIYRASSRGQSFLRQYYVLLSMLMASQKDAMHMPIIYEEQFRSR
jgi:predicted transcriptional regulator